MEFLLLDPRPQAREAMLELLRGKHVLGIEVTVPELAAACSFNIDPQHDGSGSTETAIEVVQRTWHDRPAALATVRADLDSVGAMALFLIKEEYARGGDTPPADPQRIARIAQLDRFDHGPWHLRALSEDATDWELRGLGTLTADFRVPLGERVSLMADWLTTGTAKGLAEASQSARAEWRRARAESRVETRGDVAVVTSSHRFAMEIGYAVAPIVVATNPQMRVNGGEPHLKHTVAVWPGSGALDLAGVLARLRQLEPGWGGNVAGGIIGSPQGVGSVLGVEDVVGVVERGMR